MGFGDLVILAWGTACLFVPGASVLLALRTVPLVTAVAAAPPVTVGILYVAALLGGLTRCRTGWCSRRPSGCCVLGIGLVLGRRSPAPDRRAELRALLGRPPMHLVGAAATGLAVVIGLVVWIRGIGGIGAIPQEHDTIVHTELVAHVMRTGYAAPWQSLPADLVSGESRRASTRTGSTSTPPSWAASARTRSSRSTPRWSCCSPSRCRPGWPRWLSSCGPARSRPSPGALRRCWRRCPTTLSAS